MTSTVNLSWSKTEEQAYLYSSVSLGIHSAIKHIIPSAAIRIGTSTLSL